MRQEQKRTDRCNVCCKGVINIFELTTILLNWNVKCGSIVFWIIICLIGDIIQILFPFLRHRVLLGLSPSYFSHINRFFKLISLLIMIAHIVVVIWATIDLWPFLFKHEKCEFHTFDPSKFLAFLLSLNYFCWFILVCMFLYFCLHREQYVNMLRVLQVVTTSDAMRQESDKRSVKALLDKYYPIQNYSALTIAQQECSICLKDFTKDSLVRVLQCKHVFHSCIDEWVSIKLTCPNCREIIEFKDKTDDYQPLE